MVAFEGEELLAVVVRRPTGWFYASVNENYPELAPPEDLLGETKQREEELKMQGICEEGAHNAAWDDVDFDERYRASLDDSDDAQERLASLTDRARDGQPVVLVCFEGDNKRGHRHHLAERLERRFGDS